LDAANLVFVLRDDDVSRVSLAFWAKGFYIGSDLVDLIFKHEVHYQSPEFTTTSASNTADCRVQQITGCGNAKIAVFASVTAAQRSPLTSDSKWLRIETSINTQIEENIGRRGCRAWRSRVLLL
jgi:hypothetical protein